MVKNGGVSDSAGETSADFARAARELAEAKGVVPTLEAVVHNAVSMVGCDWAIIAATDHLGEKPARLSASTDDTIAAAVAAVASTAADSPGIRAFEQGLVVVVDDLTTGAQFPDYARELVRRTPIRSVLALPLRMHDKALGVLSCYSARPGAFDQRAVEAGRILAVHGVVAVEAAREELRADNLEIALLTARTIGAAIGIVMERYALSGDDAWELLRSRSQDLNQPLALMAAELVENGTMQGLPPVRA